MSIRLSEVKSICTNAEFELVRSSRAPDIDKLNTEQVRRKLALARKSLRKWRDLSRGQDRQASASPKLAESNARSKTKVDIFEAAVASLEARLAKLEASGGGKPAAGKARRAKPARRELSRAGVRKKLTKARRYVNSSILSPDEPPSAKVEPTAPASAAAAPLPKAPAVRPKRPASKRKAAVNLGGASLTAGIAKQMKRSQQKTLGADAAAKQARLARSGRTTRVWAHTMASGKRKQARRDKKNA